MIFDWLIRRAQRTPYYHLSGYMERFWLVPYNRVVRRSPSANYATAGMADETDGTGPVTWRRPVAKLLQLCGIAVRVHHILRSDAGRDPHDHPWPYVTVVLRGGYWEHRYADDTRLVSTRWHGPGSVLVRPANSWHMLEVPDGQTAWTLFMTGPKRPGTWGFLVRPGVKVDHHEYRGRA